MMYLASLMKCRIMVSIRISVIINFVGVLQQITQLQGQIHAQQCELMPKKKFAFKSRQKEGSIPPPKSETLKDSQTNSSKVVAALTKQSKVGFRDISHKTLSMSVSSLLSLNCQPASENFVCTLNSN